LILIKILIFNFKLQFNSIFTIFISFIQLYFYNLIIASLFLVFVNLNE